MLDEKNTVNDTIEVIFIEDTHPAYENLVSNESMKAQESTLRGDGLLLDEKPQDFHVEITKVLRDSCGQRVSIISDADVYNNLVLLPWLYFYVILLGQPLIYNYDPGGYDANFLSDSDDFGQLSILHARLGCELVIVGFVMDHWFYFSSHPASKMAGLAKHFYSQPIRNEAIGVELGASNTCVTLVMGKNSKRIEDAEYDKTKGDDANECEDVTHLFTNGMMFLIDPGGSPGPLCSWMLKNSSLFVFGTLFDMQATIIFFIHFIQYGNASDVLHLFCKIKFTTEINDKCCVVIHMFICCWMPLTLEVASGSIPAVWSILKSIIHLIDELGSKSERDYPFNILVALMIQVGIHLGADIYFVGSLFPLSAILFVKQVSSQAVFLSTGPSRPYDYISLNEMLSSCYGNQMLVIVDACTAESLLFGINNFPLWTRLIFVASVANCLPFSNNFPQVMIAIISREGICHMVVALLHSYHHEAADGLLTWDTKIVHFLFSCILRAGIDLCNHYASNFSENGINGIFINQESMSLGNVSATDGQNVATKNYNHGDPIGNERKQSATNDGGNSSLNALSANYVVVLYVDDSDIFHGRWTIKDNARPFYPLSSCPFIDKDIDCQLNKRPDHEFLSWKWKPYGYVIPSLNASEFLVMLTKKKMLSVGDSLNGNMWESLVCTLWPSRLDKNIDSKKFFTFAGDITQLKSKGGWICNVIAIAADWRLNSGDGGVNVAIFNVDDRQFEIAAKRAVTLSPRKAVNMPLPSTSPLFSIERVTHIIHVLGPNKNPQRSICLNSDYVKVCEIQCLSVSPWFFAGLKNDVKVWNFQTQTEHVLSLPNGLVYALAAKYDMLVVRVQGGSILAWKTNFGPDCPKFVTTLKGLTVLTRVVGAKKLFSGSKDSTIYVWDLESLQCVEIITGHTDFLASLICWDCYLLFGSLDNSLKVWDPGIGCYFFICPSREEADKAVRAFHNENTLHGASSPLQVKYADGELERLEHNLLIEMLSKNVSDAEVFALFSEYGTVRDLQVLIGSQKTSKGYSFLIYQTKEKSLAAIEALNRKHKMENSIVPLVVKWLIHRTEDKPGDLGNSCHGFLIHYFLILDKSHYYLELYIYNRDMGMEMGYVIIPYP